MSDNTTGREGRRVRLGIGVAATTAAALAIGVGAPTANAANPGPYTCTTPAGAEKTCYAYPMVTTGPLTSLLSPFLTRIPPLTADASILKLGYALGPYSPSAPKKLYNTINSFAYAQYAPNGQSLPGQVCQTTVSGTDSCRVVQVLTTGLGAFGMANAAEGFLETVAGDRTAYADVATPGSTAWGPFTEEAGSGYTAVSGLYINNPLRPDGGLATRFAPLLNLLGINTTLPAGLAGADKNGNQVYAANTDLTWAYNTLADFPVTANPFAIVNSVFAAIPPVSALLSSYTEGGILGLLENSAGSGVYWETGRIISGKPAAQPGLGDGWALGYFQNLLNVFSGEPQRQASSFTTLGAYNPNLPILAPAEILAGFVNPLLKKVNSPYLLGTPLADVLAPMMKILVNVGYTDVVAPDMMDQLATNVDSGNLTYREAGYQPYDRQFFQYQAVAPTTFGSVNPLTKAEWAQVPGDVVKAFAGALKAQAAKPLFGFLVPNSAPPAATAVAAAARAQTQASAAATIAETAPAVSPEVPCTGAETNSVTETVPIAPVPAEANARAAKASEFRTTAHSGLKATGRAGVGQADKPATNRVAHAAAARPATR